MKTTLIALLNIVLDSVCNSFMIPKDISRNHLSLFEKKEGLLDGFFTELDNFMDDAFSRRLGNGAAFYGKRKSSFYGSEDKMKKVDANVPDPTEDFQVSSAGSFYKWMMDEETGLLKS